ncbi:MAG: 5'-methylthioadenosine/adenosylhomocysteine nucleosidase [Clostridia bacterium]|nr:5'-methylthioadenosine/adenosylhomocysteine nucleosidase [Clostridia bacterium]
MTTAIIGAMKIEVETLCKTFGAKETENGIFVAENGDDTVIICQCGIGKVNAASLTQRLIDKYSPNRIINTGTAGGLAEGLNIGDIIIAEKAAYHDFKPVSIVVDMFGDKYIHSDSSMVSTALTACAENNIPHRVGTVVTGDCFVSTEAQREDIFAEYPDALCTEMEGAAIAHVCFNNKVPFIIIRSVSDFAADEKLFDLNAAYAAEKAAIISEYIAKQ